MLGGCGSTSSDSPSAGGSAGQGTGGMGTGGVGTGGTGGAPSQTGCRGIEKAYWLFSSTPGAYFNDPYLLLKSDGDKCTAAVAVEGHPARPYSVSFSEQLVTLKPINKPAKGGNSSLTMFHLYEWKEIRLGYDQTALTGSGESDVFYRWDEEDIWGEEDLTWKIELRQPEPATLDLEQRMLPWAAAPVSAFPPVQTLAPHLEGPTSDWTFKDVAEADAVGVVQADATFAGTWDDVRGKTVTISAAKGLALLDGADFGSASASVDVIDIGAAVGTHAMSDLSTLAKLGYVAPYDQGACKTLGCVELSGCSYNGIAGQLDTTNKKEVVLSMRLRGPSFNSPSASRVAVIAEDGTRLSASKGGSFVTGQEVQDWVYDVSGYSKVGFSIEGATSCHGWGDPLLVDKVLAQ